MTGLFAPTGADAEVRRRIALGGPITFAEFMEVALYWPDGGYYSSRRSFGPLGDFYTAPLAHPVFGALVARQLLTMWRALGSPAPFTVIEPGAGDGTLALDVVEHARMLDGGFADALTYTAVDRREPPPEFPGRWIRSNGVPAAGRERCRARERTTRRHARYTASPWKAGNCGSCSSTPHRKAASSR